MNLQSKHSHEIGTHIKKENISFEWFLYFIQMES